MCPVLKLVVWIKTFVKMAWLDNFMDLLASDYTDPKLRTNGNNKYKVTYVIPGYN